MSAPKTDAKISADIAKVLKSSSASLNLLMNSEYSCEFSQIHCVAGNLNHVWTGFNSAIEKCKSVGFNLFWNQVNDNCVQMSKLKLNNGYGVIQNNRD